jgi:hypothetical protein
MKNLVFKTIIYGKILYIRKLIYNYFLYIKLHFGNLKFTNIL